MEDYERKRMKPGGVSMKADLPDVTAEFEMADPVRKTYAAAKAKVVDVGRKSKKGELF